MNLTSPWTSLPYLNPLCSLLIFGTTFDCENPRTFKTISLKCNCFRSLTRYLLMFPISWIIDINSASSASSTHTALVHRAINCLKISEYDPYMYCMYLGVYDIQNVLVLVSRGLNLSSDASTMPNLHFGHPSYISWLRP